MLPQITVFQKQHILLFLITVPVILILNALYLDSSSSESSLALLAKENALPLNVYMSGLEELA